MHRTAGCWCCILLVSQHQDQPGVVLRNVMSSRNGMRGAKVKGENRAEQKP